jgi:hypothetical protein
MWDFPTMDKTLQYYRAISPCESHQLRSIEFSPANDMLLIASGSCQGKVISRDGKIKNKQLYLTIILFLFFIFRKKYV